MAKKNNIDLFEAKPTINFSQIEAEFARLESFINDSSEIEQRAKNEMTKLVDDNKKNTGAKVPHLTNLAFLNTAVGWTNKYIQSLGK